jgi:hypothetical protein
MCGPPAQIKPAPVDPRANCRRSLRGHIVCGSGAGAVQPETQADKAVSSGVAAILAKM